MNSLAPLHRRSPSATAGRDGFAAAVHAGLGRRHKAIPAKFFYDERGSLLFERICELPEYYPTRTECALLERHAGEMAALVGPDAELLEFGAGATRKVRFLLDAMPDLRAYLPIDISAAHLQDAAARLDADYPALTVTPVAGDYTAGLRLPSPQNGARRRAGFFPGSTIGNFTPAEALAFLRNAAALLAGGGQLIGVDLVKDPAVLHAAYNDSAGVTAAFNRNLLQRLRTELDSDVDPQSFDHYAFFDPRRSRIEMHLVSRPAQEIRVGEAVYRFAAGESIHTENSCKYTLDGFRRLARRAGFRPRAAWCDPQQLFSLHWLES